MTEEREYGLRTDVILTESEAAMVLWTGVMRTLWAVRNGAQARGASRDDPTNPARHIKGAASEYAASLMMNLSWHPRIGDTGKKDIGGLVEVRCTTRVEDEKYGLPISAVYGSGPFMLVWLHDEGVYRHFSSPGWYNAEDARRKFPVRDNDEGYHVVPYRRENPILRPLKELYVQCHTKLVKDTG